MPDDERMRRYYVRDLVLPRMFQVTLGDYGQALRTGDLELARDIAGDGPRRGRVRRHLVATPPPAAATDAPPSRAREALRVSRHLPRSVRGRINPALRP